MLVKEVDAYTCTPSTKVTLLLQATHAPQQLPSMNVYEAERSTRHDQEMFATQAMDRGSTSVAAVHSSPQHAQTQDDRVRTHEWHTKA